MSHTVNFSTRLKNNHALATDNIFVDDSRLIACLVFPLSTGVSVHEVQCLILNKFLKKQKVMTDKFKI
jgi:hypothetical protein